MEQRERDVLADDGSDLQETLVFSGKPVDARRQDGLHRRGDLNRLDRLCQSIPSALSYQRLGLHQRADALLQEERVPPLDEELLERREPGIVAEQRLQQFACALGGKRVEPHLTVRRLAAPAMLVLGTIVHEQQQARRAKAVDEAIEKRLGLAVDPVQVFEHDEEWLHLALAQQQALDGVERALAALGRGQALPGRVFDRRVEQCEERGQQWLERPVETQHSPHHLVAHLPVIVPVADLEVVLQQVDYGQVAAGLAVGNGRGL